MSSRTVWKCSPESIHCKVRSWLAWTCLLGPLVLVLDVVLLFGQVSPGRHYFRVYTGAEGLSQAVVQTVFQDRQGYLWIGTQAGLNRYDGSSFRIFTIRHGLVHDWINDIAEGPDGALWLATLSGVSRFHKGVFTNYTELDGLAENRVVAVDVDRKGGVWFATRGGLSRFQGSRWQTFTTAHGLPSNTVTALLFRGSRLLVGTAAGLAWREGARFRPLEAFKGQPVTALAQDQQGRIWVGLRGGVAVLKDDQTVRPYALPERSTVPVVDVLPDRYGWVWLATPEGLGYLRPGSRTVTFLGRQNGLRQSDVRSLFEDREGVLWLGTMGGLVKFQGRAFTNYGLEEGLGSDSVRPIIRDRTGTLWVGTTGGLSRFDGRHWHNYTTRDGLRANNVLALLEDGKGRLWIGTRSGLTVWSGQRLMPSPALETTGQVVSLVKEPSGVIWAAVQPLGIFRMVGERFEQVRVEGQTFSNARLLVDHRGWVWASGDRGLSRWDGKGWRTFTVEDGLQDNQPYFLCQGPDGRIWFGYHSSRGLSVYDGKAFRHFTSADGLTNDAVYSLGFDQQGNLWIGTARGVDRFDGSTFINYGTEEGYADNESNAGGFLADRDGTLWFGTMGGLSHYDPRFDLTGGPAPRVALERVVLGEREYDPSGPIRAGSRQRDLLARVVAFSFFSEKRITFEYRLVGFRQRWTPLHGNEIRFTNLPAGDFRLEVRGRKYSGPWSKPAVVAFSITPALWETWWFWLLLVGLIVPMGWVGHRIKTRQMQLRARHLEQLVAARTKQLQEKNEELESFLYTVSHDLKAPVISLQGMASLLKEDLGEQLSEEALFYVQRIQANADRMQELINQLLELSRIGRLREPSAMVPMGDIVQAALNELQGQIQTKKARVEVDPHLPAVLCERSRLQQVWTNLISNALTYSKPDIPPEIRIGWDGEREGLYRFFIRDNGIGVPPEHRERLFEIFYRVQGRYDEKSTGVGLSIVQKVIQTHGGRVWVESEGEGKGATFWFVLPATSCKDPVRGDDDKSEGVCPDPAMAP